MRFDLIFILLSLIKFSTSLVKIPEEFRYVKDALEAEQNEEGVKNLGLFNETSLDVGEGRKMIFDFDF